MSMEQAYLKSLEESEGGNEQAESEGYNEKLNKRADDLEMSLMQELRELGNEKLVRPLVEAMQTMRRELKLATLVAAGGLAACSAAERPAAQTAYNQHCTGEPVRAVIPADSMEIGEIIAGLERDGFCIVTRPVRTSTVPGEGSQVSMPGNSYVVELIQPDNDDRL